MVNHKNRPRGKKSAPKRKFYDPDGINDERSLWAGKALDTFQELTGSDDDTALGDLLCDLMHFADRHPTTHQAFHKALSNAQSNYAAETSKEG